MSVLFTVIGVLAALTVLFFTVTFICYRMAFYAPREKELGEDEYSIPPGEIYEPHREQMIAWMKETRAFPHEEVFVTSFDGLKLHGCYYEHAPGSPIEIMFHGYRGSAERDLCGGVQRCFALGRSALVVDQRASGKSDGHVITFGIKERHDCLSWLEFARQKFGEDVELLLCGISMGAATVMMASDMDLPSNVVGIIADCGYTSPREIICKVIRQIGLPAKIMYPFVKLGAKIYGRFDLEEASAVEALKKCRVPVFFAHGEPDDFVPCAMSQTNYEACAAPKKLLTVPGAGHGLSYIIAPQEYLNGVSEVWAMRTGAEKE